MVKDTQLEEIARSHLKHWELHNDSDRLSAKQLDDQRLWLGYRHPTVIPAIAGASWHTTHFDVNIIDGVFYVLSIGIEEEHRGKGHGAALYQILEQIAKESGCKKIQMTPSGQTQTGASRKDYLLRRGYKEFGKNEVFKDV